ncbi:SAM-dependent methyltransferase [Paenibacillus aurantius]|uniref:SAM-dependent methyltransferase n=1 Tax=Paenibacillus aurantius TaxID=2918900 RepID=A0AA96RGX1_9BACL|nr:SAM-dependent methyltransferase [Paenibacillus aurantius]WNQ13497.1 SAM-dependent methyltransferase [Paenibacillus aurantius]
MKNLPLMPLMAKIRQHLADQPDKVLSFHDYMALCLYDPEDGYYMKEQVKVGKEGDFYTSASLGEFMGEMIARQYLRFQLEGERPLPVVEWGGGTGEMAKHFLDAVERLNPVVYQGLAYWLVEKSPYHRAMQQKTLRRHAMHTQWGGPEEGGGLPCRAFVFSNELLDAFPVHRVRMERGEWKELYVAWDSGKECLVEREGPCTPAVREYLDQEGIRLLEGQTAEVNLQARSWVKEQASRLEEGVLLTIDYGDTAEELYSSHRMNGTLLCYRGHLAYDDPFRFPGEQDMTSHVNFTACIRAGKEGGIQQETLRTQKEFLVDNGLLELMADHSSPDPFGPEARRNRAIRQLLLSDGMSELFKVLLQTKGLSLA